MMADIKHIFVPIVLSFICVGEDRRIEIINWMTNHMGSYGKYRILNWPLPIGNNSWLGFIYHDDQHGFTCSLKFYGLSAKKNAMMFKLAHADLIWIDL